MKLEIKDFDADGSKGPPNVCCCDLCVLRPSRCNKSCEDYYFEIKDAWNTCTKENTKVGDEIKCNATPHTLIVEHIMKSPKSDIGGDCILYNGQYSFASFLENYKINTNR